MTQSFTYPSPIGLMQFDCSDQYIITIQFTEHERKAIDIDPELEDRIFRQMEDYFEGRRFQFDLPLKPEGTDFQKRVWNQLAAIDYGQQISYLDLALRLGDKNLVRAVGGANSKNPLPIVVPCHRVIGSNKKLVGYAGGLWRKKWLLRHELEFRQSSHDLF